MRKLLYIILAIALCAACHKEPVPVPEVETAEDILLAVEHEYKVESVKEERELYVIIFDAPTPVKVKKEHPSGIEKVELKKSDVTSFEEKPKSVDIVFKDGKSVSLAFCAWLSATFNTDYISFDEGQTSDGVFFEIKESNPESFTVNVTGCEEYADFQVELNKSGRGGCITFTPKSAGYFTVEATIELSNGRRSVYATVSLIRENFKFADGTVEKSFSFLEYERYFEVGMENADKSVAVMVPPECASWLQATVSTVNLNGKDKTTVCFLLSENPGNEARSAMVTVSREGGHRELYVNVSQIGSQMDGSFKKGLLAFYEALNGAQWNCNDNWGSDAPLFEWYGIKSCSVSTKALFGDDGFAYFGTDDRWILDLSANNMRGTVPEEFWKVCHCFSSIRISGEYLPTSTFPDYVWNENLSALDLSMSFMKVSLSSAIARAVNLESLLLQACTIEGGLPSELSTLSHLWELNCRECSLTGELPKNIGNLQSLEICYFDHNMDLGGVLPSSFYNLANLRSFDIGSTQIGGKLSPDIARLSRLEDFNISGCEFEGTIPEEFGQLEKIVSYDFQGNYFTAIPQFVRYIGFNSKEFRQWVGSAGFPLGVPYYQRDRKAGRPKDYIVVVPDVSQWPEILVDGQPLKRPGYYVDYDKCNLFKMPKWANIKYGISNWNTYRDGEAKFPEYPYADDLQYPADEYYYDGKDWRHPKLEHPAREYWFNGTDWVHDPSCPWDREYIDRL